MTTNVDLAREARSTSDCDRQQELASHPSDLVKWNLVRNGSLCDAAREILGDEIVQRLLRLTEQQVRNAIDVE